MTLRATNSNLLRSLGPRVLRRAALGLLTVASVVAAVLMVASCGEDDQAVTVYSGRSESLIGPVLAQFAEETGIEVAVRYAGTAELATLLIEEGDRSPADVYIAQDAGGLGAVQAAGLFAELDEAVLERVASAYRSREGQWVGLSGRVRVVVYNTDAVDPAELPDSILGFTDPKWKGRIGWAPTNGSFQAFVTALRVHLGEAGARAWLEGILANDPVEYAKNTPIVEAAGRGEIDVGFVNHYYLHRFLAAEGESFSARNHYTGPGDVGTLVNVAGAGVLRSSQSADAAQRLIEFLLSEAAQRHFAEENAEYPLVASVPASADLPSIAALEPPPIDLSRLEDIAGTLELLRSVGVLP